MPAKGRRVRVSAPTEGARGLAGRLAEQGHRRRGAPGSTSSDAVAPALPGRQNRALARTRDARATRHGHGRGEVRIVHATLHDKPVDATHWSTRTLAERLGLESGPSAACVEQQRPEAAPEPDLQALSRDPRFDDKLSDVVSLYMNPPNRAPLRKGPGFSSAAQAVRPLGQVDPRQETWSLAACSGRCSGKVPMMTCTNRLTLLLAMLDCVGFAGASTFE